MFWWRSCCICSPSTCAPFLQQGRVFLPKILLSEGALPERVDKCSYFHSTKEQCGTALVSMLISSPDVARVPKHLDSCTMCLWGWANWASQHITPLSIAVGEENNAIPNPSTCQVKCKNQDMPGITEEPPEWQTQCDRKVSYLCMGKLIEVIYLYWTGNEGIGLGFRFSTLFLHSIVS